MAAKRVLAAALLLVVCTAAFAEESYTEEDKYKGSSSYSKGDKYEEHSKAVVILDCEVQFLDLEHCAKCPEKKVLDELRTDATNGIETGLDTAGITASIKSGITGCKGANAYKNTTVDLVIKVSSKDATQDELDGAFAPIEGQDLCDSFASVDCDNFDIDSIVCDIEEDLPKGVKLSKAKTSHEDKYAEHEDKYADGEEYDKESKY